MESSELSGDRLMRFKVVLLQFIQFVAICFSFAPSFKDLSLVDRSGLRIRSIFALFNQIHGLN
jgi:hypothetical protein